jgi:hypothetical protein
MQTTDKKMFRDMQEHPEKYSDQQIESMMDELDRVPDVESAWQKFSAEQEESTESSQSHIHTSRRWLKVAASFIGVLLVTGLAFAAIHFVQRSGSAPNSARDSGEKAGVVMTNRNDSLPPQGEVEEASIIFENVPLDSMLMEMANYYQVGVEFTREETRQLRFHFVWKRNESLDRVLERLNNFKAVNIEKSDTVIIVE